MKVQLKYDRNHVEVSDSIYLVSSGSDFFDPKEKFEGIEFFRVISAPTLDEIRERTDGAHFEIEAEDAPTPIAGEVRSRTSHSGPHHWADTYFHFHTPITEPMLVRVHRSGTAPYGRTGGQPGYEHRDVSRCVQFLIYPASPSQSSDSA
jgi:hypothetical protein